MLAMRPTPVDLRKPAAGFRVHDGCFDAKRSAAESPECDQHDRAPGHPTGCPRRAQRGGAPQGTRNFDKRSDVEVYGAYTFFCREGDCHPPEGTQGWRFSSRQEKPLGRVAKGLE